MARKIGARTLELSKDISILSGGNAVGKFEGEGPLGRLFDDVINDEYFGEKTYEQAEIKLQKRALANALQKGGLDAAQLDMIAAGDLLNQCVSSSYCVRDNGVPFVGLFGACSTMAQTLALAAILVDSGAADLCCAVTSSHFCAAERQFRFPLEYGGQRPPTAQWTATAAGAAVVGLGGHGAHIADATIGRVCDLGVTDANNMGAAMAPSAADTLLRYFEDTGTVPGDYDRIATGDLAAVGSDLLRTLMRREGQELGDRYVDCGLLLFDRQRQDAHAGGYGCGCSAAVLCGHLLRRIACGELSNVLFLGTGALMSPTSVQQGESIPGITHLVHLTAPDKT